MTQVLMGDYQTISYFPRGRPNADKQQGNLAHFRYESLALEMKVHSPAYGGCESYQYAEKVVMEVVEGLNVDKSQSVDNGSGRRHTESYFAAQDLVGEMEKRTGTNKEELELVQGRLHEMGAEVDDNPNDQNDYLTNQVEKPDYKPRVVEEDTDNLRDYNETYAQVDKELSKAGNLVEEELTDIHNSDRKDHGSKQATVDTVDLVAQEDAGIHNDTDYYTGIQNYP